MNRRFRLLAALGMALVLSTFMLYTAFAGQDVREPVLQISELDRRDREARRQTVQLDGVAAGPLTGEEGERFSFHVRDRDTGDRVRVAYEGSVPDAFRVGRHVIVKGTLRGSGTGRVFRAVPDSLVTKCPSKFEAEGGSGRSSS